MDLHGCNDPRGYRPRLHGDECHVQRRRVHRGAGLHRKNHIAGLRVLLRKPQKLFFQKLFKHPNWLPRLKLRSIRAALLANLVTQSVGR